MSNLIWILPLDADKPAAYNRIASCVNSIINLCILKPFLNIRAVFDFEKIQFPQNNSVLALYFKICLLILTCLVLLVVVALGEEEIGLTI